MCLSQGLRSIHRMIVNNACMGTNPVGQGNMSPHLFWDLHDVICWRRTGKKTVCPPPPPPPPSSNNAQCSNTSIRHALRKVVTATLLLYPGLPCIVFGKATDNSSCARQNVVNATRRSAGNSSFSQTHAFQSGHLLQLIANSSFV